jgi:hypothetical protein
MKLTPKPFSGNIIFFDTEFTGNDISAGEVLSIGMVKPNGEELYLELEFQGEVSGWVKKNIIPTLILTKTKRVKAIKKLLNSPVRKNHI